MKKVIGIIGQFPPPIHGLSKALDTLYNSYLNDKYKLVKFDITSNKKILLNLFHLVRTNCDLHYLTISQSVLGNIRDIIILTIIILKQKKIVIHLHGGGFRNLLDNKMPYVQRKMNYYILNKVDKLIVLGDSLKSNFKGIVNDEKIYTIKNCVDDDYVLNDDDFDAKISDFENKDVLKILYLSNFVKEKGFKEVLELSRLCNQNNMKVKFIFAGKFFDKKDKEYFLNFVENNNLNRVIEYRGIVKGREKIELLRECDYFILLTRYKNEGQPISIIEAAANGLRVISTNHAGIKDILNSEEMIMYDKNEIVIKDIVKKIEYEYSNRQPIIKILINNRKKILSEFSESQYLCSIDKIFRAT
ncbi:Glycosyltransferase involved in cell wall bisynthesis [Clostridium sp. DSM 8431]|uniref:glycosyltransferase family 4 protein n=1 Tax=Clostridium sp. DSM 8431 TaxID=1761781 RepID=UPI0008E83CDB|nr:glycosyltransferase family 4 protein [Clostridium sp. DSM 8431]SFU65893.1 Glycosyltransferase involved in cell wall bisynthesis [Clostridium sp. DSM 8431]